MHFGHFVIGFANMDECGANWTETHQNRNICGIKSSLSHKILSKLHKIAQNRTKMQNV